MARHGKKWRNARAKVHSLERYGVDEALALVRETSSANFNETLECAVRLGVDPRHADQMIRGAVSLPNGTGRDVRVVVFAQGEAAKAAEAAGADLVGGDDLVKKISEGWLEFDKAVATRDMMGKVGRLGRVLGPRGLMPNPKVGTVVAPDPDAVAGAVKQLKAGRIEFRTEKAGIVHAPVGKLSMTDEQLKENLSSLIATLVRLKPASAKGTYMRSVAISSTMGVGVRLDVHEAVRVSESV